MKRVKPKKQQKLNKIFTIIVFALIAVASSLYGLNNYEKASASDVTFKKGITANKNVDGSLDGTYKISLDITGAADTTSTTAKANILIVYDVSGSMTSHNTYMAYETGRYAKRGNDYVTLYRNSNCTGSINNNTTSGTVYYYN